MSIGIIDIGSNSLKACVYDISGGTPKIVDRCIYYTNLYAHIKDGLIDGEGAACLKKSFEDAAAFLRGSNCAEIAAYATEAIRLAENGAAIADKIASDEQISLEILSGDEEAECDLLSVMAFTGQSEGAGMDMGGGSAQIFLFADRKAYACASLPIGALRLKQQFVAGNFPASDEAVKLADYVRVCVSAEFKEASTDVLYLMGGTANVIKNIARVIYGKECIAVDTLRALYKHFLKLGEDDRLSFLNEYAKDRELLVMPCLIALLVIADHFSIDTFRPIDVGSREGYVIKIKKLNG